MKKSFYESLFSQDSHKRWRYIASIMVFTALGACSGQNNNDVSPVTLSPSIQEEARIGLIVPLTGPYAPIGQRMKDAALLAMKLPEQDNINSENGHSLTPEIDIFDSHAAGGAKRAAQEAIESGDKIVIGPILSGETEQVADILQTASIPELAFTSNVEQARPNAVWVMGLTPEQQVHRLVDMAVSEGRQHFAAFLPETALGHALAQGLVSVCQEKGLEIPKIIFHTRDISSITEGMASLSNLKEREAALPVSAMTPPDSSSISAEETSQELSPPPFDALLLADTGLDLAHVIEALKANQIDSLKVRIMGPALWKAFDSKLGDLKGAWYSAPDDQLRTHYVQDYQAYYHQGPSPVTDFAYDAARLARRLIEDKKLTREALTSPEGFDGVGGHYNLLEDGHVMRALAIYQILLGGGGQLIIPATQMASPQ